MRLMLSSFNASEPLQLGFRYENPNNGIYFMSGGPGYILTREALRRFVEIGISDTNFTEPGSKESEKSHLNNNSICAFNPEAGEDVNLGINTQD